MSDRAGFRLVTVVCVAGAVGLAGCASPSATDVVPAARPAAGSPDDAVPAPGPPSSPARAPTGSSAPSASPVSQSPGSPAASSAPPSAPRRPGAYYLDDGPGDRLMELAADVADAEPRPEPLHPRANRPYQVFGRDYVPLTERRAFRQRGMATWYGRKFHGQPTSTGEPYDMYAMSGAHPTLPLPSFVRVTNLDNGRAVVVRINDRGPFLKDRVIDLSAAAAWRLGYFENGSAPVEVELIPTSPSPEGQQALRLLQSAADVEAARSAGSLGAAPVGAGSAAAPSDDATFAHYVQLAAFGSRGAAEAAQRKLQLEFDWLDVPVRVVENASVYRVQAGPYAAFQRAREVAGRVERITGQRPWIVARP